MIDGSNAVVPSVSSLAKVIVCRHYFDHLLRRNFAFKTFEDLGEFCHVKNDKPNLKKDLGTIFWIFSKALTPRTFPTILSTCSKC